MIVGIRVDASKELGAGHFFRCLTLARCLSAAGADVKFFAQSPDRILRQRVATLGLSLIALRRDFDQHSLSPNPKSKKWQDLDAKEFVSAVGELGTKLDWVVVDHYFLDSYWERQVRQIARAIMVIDDLANRAHDADILIDQNLGRCYESRYAGLVPRSCKLLLGPTYALIRREFAQARSRSAVRTGPVRRLVVSFGGSDPTNETTKSVNALLGLKDGQWKADVVLGPFNNRVKEVEALVGNRSEFRVHCDPVNLCEILAKADLAIGGAGVTAIERASLYLPAIVVTVADNQLEIAHEMSRRGIVTYVGKSNEVTSTDIRVAVERMMSDVEALRRQSLAAGALTDGRGVQRVRERMYERGTQ